MFNKSKARMDSYSKEVEQQGLQAISAKTRLKSMRIHLWRMIGLLHKPCHPKSLLVATENAAAATSSPQAKRPLKAALWKAKE